MVINFSTTTTLFVFMTGISAQPIKSEYFQMLSMICKFFYFVTTIAEGRVDAFYFVTTEERCLSWKSGCLPSCIFQIDSDKRFNALDWIFQRNTKTFQICLCSKQGFGFSRYLFKDVFFKDVYIQRKYLVSDIVLELETCWIEIWFALLICANFWFLSTF